MEGLEQFIFGTLWEFSGIFIVPLSAIALWGARLDKSPVLLAFWGFIASWVISATWDGFDVAAWNNAISSIVPIVVTFICLLVTMFIPKNLWAWPFGIVAFIAAHILKFFLQVLLATPGPVLLILLITTLVVLAIVFFVKLRKARREKREMEKQRSAPRVRTLAKSNDGSSRRRAAHAEGFPRTGQRVWNRKVPMHFSAPSGETNLRIYKKSIKKSKE